MFLKSALMYLKGLVQAPRHQKTETCMKSKGLLTAQRSDVEDDLLCLQSDTHFFVFILFCLILAFLLALNDHQPTGY